MHIICTHFCIMLGYVDSSFSCMDVSKNSGTPKSSILIGISIINHRFWGTTIFGNTRINNMQLLFFWGVCFLKTYCRSLQTFRPPPGPHLWSVVPPRRFHLGDGLKAAGMKDNDLHLGLLGDGFTYFWNFHPDPLGKMNPI